LLQEELKEILNQQFVMLYKQAAALPFMLNDFQILQKQTQLSQVLTPLTISIPQNSASMQVIYKGFTENLKRIKSFFNIIYNPITIGKLVLDINSEI
jgi:hypothetical protein